MSNFTQYRVLRGQQAIDAAKAVDADKAECGCTGRVGPSHMRGYFHNGVFYNGGCASGSMWYDPETKQLQGRSHCSCEEKCF